MASVGRNDPCPCGSGRKYKRCCAARAAEERAERQFRPRAQRLDEEWASELLRRGNRWFGKDRVFEALALAAGDELEDAGLAFAVPLILYEQPFENDETIAERFVREGRARTDEAREWFAAQREAWLSIWQVQEVRAGEGLQLRDLLTGRERFVHDVIASRAAANRVGLLARTLEFDGAAYFSGLHPRPLPPRETEAAATEVRSVLGIRGRTTPKRLREHEARDVLVATWDETCEEIDERPPPELCNTDGHPLLFTRDHFLFVPGDRERVLEALGGIPHAEHEATQRDGQPDVVRFSRPEPDGLRWTLVALARISDDVLVVETNSVDRADDWREMVARAAAGLIRHRGREHEATEPAMERWQGSVDDAKGGDSDEADLDPAQAAALVRAWKEQHYASWPDEPLPALGGKTPRGASTGSARLKRELNILLAELELGESRLPEDQRFDVSKLRRSLGMDD